MDACHLHEILIFWLLDRLNADDQIVEVFAAIRSIVFEAQLKALAIKTVEFRL